MTLLRLLPERVRLNRISLKNQVEKSFDQAKARQTQCDTLGLLCDDKQNQLTYWTARIALHGDDDSNWLRNRELLMFLLSERTSGRYFNLQNSNIQKLTDDNVEEFVPKHMRHFVPDVTKMWVCSDFNLLAPLISENVCTIVNGNYVFELNDEIRFYMKIADFLQKFDAKTELCAKIAQDPEIDPNFMSLLRKTQLLRYGEIQIQSLQQSIGQGLTIQNLEQLIARGAVPLCAIRLIRQLKNQHKLKYQERQQLYCFLKDAGMSADDAIVFIKQHFCAQAAMTEDKFNKEYKYQIQHIYGKVGSKKQAVSACCATLIEQTPGTGYVFGCPWKTMPVSDIEDMVAQNIKGNMKDMMAHSYTPLEQKYYIQACGHMFNRIFNTGMAGTQPYKFTVSARDTLKQE